MRCLFQNQQALCPHLYFPTVWTHYYSLLQASKSNSTVLECSHPSEVGFIQQIQALSSSQFANAPSTYRVLDAQSMRLPILRISGQYLLLILALVLPDSILHHNTPSSYLPHLPDTDTIFCMQLSEYRHFCRLAYFLTGKKCNRTALPRMEFPEL